MSPLRVVTRAELSRSPHADAPGRTAQRMHTMMAAADAAGSTKAPGKRVALPWQLQPAAVLPPASSLAGPSPSPAAALTPLHPRIELEASLGQVARGGRTGGCLATALPLPAGGASPNSNRHERAVVYSSAQQEQSPNSRHHAASLQEEVLTARRVFGRRLVRGGRRPAARAVVPRGLGARGSAGARGASSSRLRVD